MKIKSTSLLLALPLLGALMVSCKLDDDKKEQTLSSYVNQMVIPADASQEVSVQTGVLYKVDMDLNAQTMVISAGGVKIDGNGYLFQTDPMKYQFGYDGYRGESYQITGNCEGMLGNMRVTGIKGYLTSLIPNYSGSPLLVLNYKVDGSTVKTFAQAPLFAGTTITHYPGGPMGGEQTATTKDATYGISFSQDMKTANVYIYEVKFAPSMPSALEVVQLKNLKVTLADGGYRLEGADIVPQVREAGEFIDYPAFPFSKFELHTTDEYLTSVSCAYTVAAEMAGKKMNFRGEFEGKCAEYFDFSEGAE